MVAAVKQLTCFTRNERAKLKSREHNTTFGMAEIRQINRQE